MKMFNINNITRTAATLALSAFAFVSCLEIDDQQSGALGYLEAPELDVDVTVEDLTQTKAIDFEVVAPKLSAVRFVVKDKDGNVKYDGQGLWTEPLVLPVGAYTVEATSGVNGFGKPYFTGSAGGSISPLSNVTPQLRLALSNSLMNVTVDESFAEHFTGQKVIFNSGGFEAGFGEWVYVPAGSDLPLSLIGKNSAENQVEFPDTLSAPSPKVAYRVTFGQKTTDWPTISLAENSQVAWASRIYITSPASFTGKISDENKADVVYEAIPSSSSDWKSAVAAVTENGVKVIKGLTPGTRYQVRARVGALTSNVVEVTPALDGFSATASHTYSGGELDGTDVTSTFSKPDVVKNSIASWSINLCKSDGTELRTELSLGTSVGAAITATNGWPYLPAGSYKLVAQVTMKDGEVVENIISDSFSTEKPSFTVTASAYTSYDKYLLRDLNFANNVANKHTVFERRASVSISDYILANTNYSDIRSSSITFNSKNIGSFDTHSEDFGNDENCTSWQNYPFKATMTFDGVTKESSVDCHITGLPYTAAPPSNDSQKTGGHPWTEDQRGWGVVYFQWNTNEFITWNTSGSGNTNIIGSPRFNIPSAIPVDIYMMAHGYKNVVSYHIDIKVHAGGGSVSNKIDGSDNNYDSYHFNTLSLTGSAPKVQIENTHVSGNYRRLHIQSVQIEYR